MDESQIRELAARPKENIAAIESRMAELKLNGARILECILYVKLNQGCSLLEASDIVINSNAWIDQKQGFLQHQADMFEEFIQDSMENIESIQQTFTPDGTKTIVQMKPGGSCDNTA
jgi:hypothetical protein